MRSLVLAAVLFAAPSSWALESTQARRYLDSTLQGLAQMRGDQGLLHDRVQVAYDRKTGEYKLGDDSHQTSPTNIALDLLVQAEAGNLAAVEGVLTALEKMQYHAATGLFFSWYETNGEPKPVAYGVSAIDNFHLALALWALKTSLPKSTIAPRAAKLLARMSFAGFVDEERPLLHGNYIKTADGWEREAYVWGHIGSETRGVYGAGWALGLLGSASASETFPSRALDSVLAEVAVTPQGRVMRTWDGGAFQLLLPELLIGESDLSPQLKASIDAFARYIKADAAARKLPLPAGHSACDIGVDKVDYSGMRGSRLLVSKINSGASELLEGAKWDSVVTPHAIFLATQSTTEDFSTELKNAEKLGANMPLYVPKLGWMDGFVVSGAFAGSTVPTQLSLDQSMLAMSLQRKLSKDGLTFSARALRSDPQIWEKLRRFYAIFDKKLSAL